MYRAIIPKIGFIHIPARKAKSMKLDPSSDWDVFTIRWSWLTITLFAVPIEYNIEF